MNTKDLSKITIVKKCEIAKHCWQGITTLAGKRKKVVEWKSSLIPWNIKETIHYLKNPKHISKFSNMLLEMCLSNLR